MVEVAEGGAIARADLGGTTALAGVRGAVPGAEVELLDLAQLLLTSLLRRRRP